MEPLSALGLAANIITFVEFTYKLVSKSHEIYLSSTGMADEHADLATVTTNVHLLTDRLSAGPASTKDETVMVDLAKKCRKLSEDLLRALSKLQTKNPESKSESFRVAWRAMREKGKLESLEKRIDMYRRQVFDKVIIMMRVLSLAENLRLDKDKESPEPENSTELAHTPVTAEVPHIEIGALLLRLTKMTAQLPREDWILNRLSFAEMHHREMSIEAAHAKTFRWLLHDPLDDTLTTDSESAKVSELIQEKDVTGPEDGFDDLSKHDVSSSELPHKDLSNPSEISKTPKTTKCNLEDLVVEKEDGEGNGTTTIDKNNDFLCTDCLEWKKRGETRTMFLNWLNTGMGVFHISGKLGSGKSTLLKLLAKDSRTEYELKRWAGKSKKELIFSHFFFWSSGSPMQRSLEGLYRGIMWETLRQCPDLMADVFPEVNFNPRDDRLQNGPFAFSELQAAFDRLIKSKSAFRKHKICFLIDGLDEFEGDHWKLAHELKSWANAGDLKICVSSRPYNEFIQNFTDPNKHLQLHDLTRQDIVSFVEDEFEQDERSVSFRAQGKHYTQFANSLVAKADGVFLWVRLATREILSGMGNSYSISQLEEELDQLPEDLDALFRKMMASNRTSDRKRAARTFLLILDDAPPYCAQNKLVWVHAVIDEFLDGSYDTAQLYTATLDSPMTREDAERMTDLMSNRLNSRCKGLIQIFKPESPTRVDRSHLAFIHRSVGEFLAAPDVRKDLLELAEPSFDPTKYVCMALLRLVKSSHGLAKNNRGTKHDIDLHFSDSFGSYFWILRELALPVLEIARRTETETSCPLLRECKVASDLMQKLCTCLPTTLASQWPLLELRSAPWSTYFIFSSKSNPIEAHGRAWLSLCFLRGPKRYVLDRAMWLADPVCPLSGVEILFLSTIGDTILQTDWGKIKTKRQLVLSVLEGGVSPNLPFLDVHQNHSLIPSFPPVKQEGRTAWTASLLLLTADHLKLPPPADAPADAHNVCKVIQHYLKFGADPSVLFVGYEFVLSEAPLDRTMAIGIREIPVEPKYFDLGQFLEIWDAPNKQDALDLWNKVNQPRTLWEEGLSLDNDLSQSKTVHQIRRIDTDSLLSSSSSFLVLTVVSAQDLPKVDISEVEKWVQSTEGRDELLCWGPGGGKYFVSPRICVFPI